MPGQLPAAVDTNACGIDLGWRKVNDGIRVATIVADDIGHQFITLPPVFIERRRRIVELDSRRALSAEAARRPLRGLKWPDAPPPLRPLAMAALRTRRSEDLWALALEWRTHADWHPEAFAALDGWRSQDRNQWMQREGLSNRIVNARRYFYRDAVKKIVARYGLIGIEAVNWADIGRRVNRDGADNEIATSTATYRLLAAPGCFIQELRRSAAAGGARIHEHGGKSSFICHDCGAENFPADRSELVFTCSNPSCGSTWDQDVNAGGNLCAAAIASAPAPPQGPPPLAAKNTSQDNDQDDDQDDGIDDAA